MFNSATCDIEEYFTFKSDYVSCIKINGQPILPPLMTPERCMEMQEYKQLALEVEKKLKRNKTQISYSKSDTKNIQNNDNLEDLICNENLNTCDDHFFQPIVSHSSSAHIPEKQNLTLGDNKLNSENSELSTSRNSFIIELDANPKIYKGDSSFEKPNTISPNRPSIDSGHYGTGDTTITESSDPPRLIRTNSYILDTPSPLLLSFLENQRANMNSAPPKSANIDRVKLYSNNSNINENRRRSCWDLASAKEKWTSFENNINFAFIPSKINIKNVKSKFNRTKSASLPASASPSPTKQLDSKVIEPKTNLRRNSLTNDLKSCKTSNFSKRPNSLNLKETVDNKSPISTYSTENLQFRNHNKESSKIEIDDTLQEREYELVLNSIENYEVSETTQCRGETIDDKMLLLESKIKEMYQTIQTEHSKKMAELMIQQKKEQEMLITHFKQQQMLFIDQIRNNYLNISNGHITDENSIRIYSNNSTTSPNCILNNNNPLPTVDNYISVPESASESEDMSSQTIHFQPDNNSTVTTPDYCLNVESIISESPYTDNEDVNSIVRSMLNKSRSEQGNIYIQNNIPVRFHINNYTNISNFEACDIESVIKCNRQLFSNVRKNSNSLEICAVIKIQAGIRGYLVRRLLRTERVQSLIQTLKDTLICALEFHSENIDNIQPADVELHKRLIQQLTAACFAIHDTFFKLTIKEKMAIISSDRQRIKDKMLRPLSARNSPVLSATTQKTIQRKLHRSNLPSPAYDENQATNRKSSEYSRIGRISPGGSNPSLVSLMKINSNIGSRKDSTNNKISIRKPWR